VIHLWFVGDGDLDGIMVPRLVERTLGVPVREEVRRWPRLHGRGYEKKLRFATLQAEDGGAGGLVATVDADRNPERIRTLRAARDSQRTIAPSFPTALGQAEPHGEAWLLDDDVAVRTALRLPGDTEVPSVRHANTPKENLQRLHAMSTRAGEPLRDIYRDIAASVEIARCRRPRDTGFKSFADDVRAELASLSVRR